MTTARHTSRTPTRGALTAAAILAALLSLAIVPLACGPGTPSSPAPANLIVVSVDTLRADHMSLHGYPRSTTPEIDAFAARSATFERAIAPWPKTVPSMVSIFSSRYPHVTGVMFGSRGQWVSDDELMLAEIARDRGLATGAVVSNAVLSSSTNFNQGFGEYVETYEVESPLGRESRNHADSVTLHARLLLRRLAAEGPFFLWVHYVDPHTLYEPPPEFARPFLEDEHYDPEKLRLNQDEGNLHGGVAPKFWRRNGGQDELGWYVARYDGEIAFTDREIGRLLDEVEELELMDDTAIVLTADHGESLGDHQYFFEHGWFPYHASGWIPWVVYWPGMPRAGVRLPYPSSLLNLVPTIVDVMGWELDDPPFQGRSVVPVIAGAADRVDRYVIEEAGEGALKRSEFLRSIQDGDWKLIHVPDEHYRSIMQGAPYELYHVPSDPNELRDLADREPDRVAEMSRILEERLRAAGPVAPAPRRETDYSPDELENLRALGYIR